MDCRTTAVLSHSPDSFLAAAFLTSNRANYLPRIHGFVNLPRKEEFMKAVRIHEYGNADQLRIEETPNLTAGDDQVLVKIRDAGVNPIDWKIRAGHMKQLRPVQFPLTMGQDFAGEVVGRGKQVHEFDDGERVFGFAQGTYSEYAAAPVSTIAAIPESVSFEVAAALPTAGSTALQIIRDSVNAQPGMTVLIHGAAGGVGSFAVQIAKSRGAKVIGTATGAEDIQYLKSIGTDQVIDFKQERFEDKVHEVDAVVDLVGGETQKKSFAVLKKGGILVSTVQPVDESAAKRAGIRGQIIVMQHNGDDLRELAALVAKGTVKPRMGRTLPFTQAKEAQELSEHGGSNGKLILKVA
jgi:NADPH:quinone reductase-like Zn-dependent oxidoreductase